MIPTKKSISCNGKLLDLSTPIVMGILNITPDSFYDGGLHRDMDDIIKHCQIMLNEGATIIDIGAVSTRPYSEHVPMQEELNRLIPALSAIRQIFPDIIISVDTFRSQVASLVVSEYNVDIINDISGGNFDDLMFETIARLHVPYMMMHIKGTPQNMQADPDYTDVVAEIIETFAQKIEKLKLLGVNDIVIDPGFGFGKSMVQNYEILNHLEAFQVLGTPILVGLSRKSLIYRSLQISPNESLNGTTVLNTIALLKGINILRVHDVKQAVEAIQLVKLMQPK